MRLFVDYIATKKVIASALGSIVGGVSDLCAFSGAQIADAMRPVVKMPDPSPSETSLAEETSLGRRTVG
jgi:hypothetical protein